MPRTIKEPEQRKQEIVEAALELFSQNGYANTTIQDIAGHLGIATGLCYRYFKSKQEIFAATSEYYAKQAVAGLHTPLPPEAGAIEKFNSVIQFLLAYAIRHNEFEASFQQELAISAARLDELSKQVVQEMLPIVEQGIAEGVFHCNDVTRTVTFLTFGIAHMIHLEMPVQAPQAHIRSFVPLIQALCCNTLGVTDPQRLGKGWLTVS